MIQLRLKYYFLFLFTSILFFSGCSDDDDPVDPKLEVPSTYTFTRDGASSVSFSGQTDRLNMLAEMKTAVKEGDAGNAVTQQALLNMYANENTPFTDDDLNASTKDLESKTFISDVQFFKDLYAELETNSADVAANSTVASSGVAGLLDRDGNGKTILVNAKGWEYTQFIEKGLMGAVFYNQIYNTYLTDARIGSDVDNTTIVDGKNYTAKEHHWDEAFGYFGVPIDFPSGSPVLESAEDRFWAKYTIDLDSDVLIPGINQTLMNAYLTGRTAIVNNDNATLNTQRDLIYKWHEIVAAAIAIHYINSAISDFNNNDTPNLFHHLSEAYAFVLALKYSPAKQLSSTEINTILNTDFGTDANFWTVTLDGLNTAKATIASKYTEIDSIKDLL